MPPTGGFDDIVLDAKYVVVFSDYGIYANAPTRLLFMDDLGVVAAAAGCSAKPTDLQFGTSLLK
ncbi:MAG: hypothetical protein M3P30_05080 [Chloroflexota bacterium]|nr:hypothetical protein [Chloroflexota bacterium]